MEDKEGLALIFSNSPEDKWYEEFTYGVEEEGVPLFIIDAEKELLKVKDALHMAMISAEASCFEVGIGVDDESIVIRHRLQKEADPLLEIKKAEATDANLRILGHNAARIVKRIPLFLEG